MTTIYSRLKNTQRLYTDYFKSMEDLGMIIPRLVNPKLNICIQLE